MAKEGSLSITSENIFPVIKKWLYSDHDIFYRELISDSSGAITELKKLELTGEYERPENLGYKIQVSVNPNDKTIKITGNGPGVTEDEIDKYINQIAPSGVQDSMEKYEDEVNEDQIIGHFGLGFYSTFMVADKVSIDSLPYQRGSKPIHWESEGGIGFEVEGGDKTEVGTTVTLYLNGDSTKFYSEYRTGEVVEKYCAFVFTDIFLDNEMVEPQYETVEKDEFTDEDTVVETVIEPAKAEEKEKEDGTKEVVEIKPPREKHKVNKRPVTLNNINPLWSRHPNECSEEDYKSFCRKVFRDYEEPLFRIHLSMDYPFNLKGILYFPKINMEYDSPKGIIRLYNSQVFIADNIKEAIPELLMLLKGAIDCPDLSLNISKDAPQNDGFVKKISNYIMEKIVDKLSGMCRTDRDSYERYQDDIMPFIKFGYIRGEKFVEKMGDFILYRSLEGEYLILQGCLDGDEEKHESTIFYVTNEKGQSQYVNMSREEGVDAVIVPATIDDPFISRAEQKEEGLKSLRIGTDLSTALKEDVKEDDGEFKKTSEELTECFKKALNNNRLNARVEGMKNTGTVSMVTISEDTHCMQDMMKMYSVGGMNMGMFGGTSEALVLNANHSLVQYILGHKDDASTSKICEQLYDLTSLSHNPLAPNHMTVFVSRSDEVMMTMASEKTESEKTE